MPLQDAPKRLEQGLDWKRTIKNRERAFGQHGVQTARGIGQLFAQLVQIRE